MKLGFDIDGITCNMAQALVDLINDRYDLGYDVDVFKDHALHNNTYVDDPELNEEIATTMRNEIIENPAAIPGLDILEDAVIAIRKLAKSGHSIHHITSRPSNQFDACASWLRKHFIPFDTLHVIGNSGKDGFKVSKGRIGRMLNLDFYIDDCIWHLEDMYRYKSRWRKGLALFTQPWNVNDKVDANLYWRFDNWNDIIRHLGIHKR